MCGHPDRGTVANLITASGFSNRTDRIAITPLPPPPQRGLDRPDLVTAVVAAAFLVDPDNSSSLIGAHDWR